MKDKQFEIRRFHNKRVTIPERFLSELNLNTGDYVRIRLDQDKNRICLTKVAGEKIT